jgi:hypothetical protein
MSTKVRVLAKLDLDDKSYEPNTILLLDDKVAKSLQQAGQVDANKDAVNYCVNTLKVTPITHSAEPEDPDTPPA